MVSRLRQLACAGVLASIPFVPALATETVSCSATDGSDVTIEMNLSSGMPADLPNWVRITAGETAWSTLGIDEGATPIAMYQAFNDGDLFAVDVADEPVSNVVASLRVLKGEEGGTIVRAGYLRIIGASIHPVTCDFGDSE